MHKRDEKFYDVCVKRSSRVATAYIHKNLHENINYIVKLNAQMNPHRFIFKTGEFFDFHFQLGTIFLFF